MTQALLTGTVVVLVFLAITLVSPTATGRALGSSETLMPLVTDYMPWIFACCLPQIWCAIGLFVVRLDGSPKYAMWCNVLPGLINIVLDYVFIFPLDMGLKGAGIATFISVFVGGAMVVIYVARLADKLKLIRIKTTITSLALSIRNIGYQCKIGISALLGEATMGMVMLMGNIVFMKYIGDDGVGAYSIACYYMPLIFMVGNSIAQSAQPIISYNYGIGDHSRVVATERIAVIVAIASGFFCYRVVCIPSRSNGRLILRRRFTGYRHSERRIPHFSTAFVAFIFNITAIGYFQSVEKVAPSIVFALLRGMVFIIPSYLLMPCIAGTTGIWLALGVSEILTAICIVAYYLAHRK